MKRFVFTLILVCLVSCSLARDEADLEEVTEKIFLDVTIGGITKVGRIVLGLFGNTVPLTVKNFATICTEGVNNNQYNFNGTIFHRVIKQFMIQGGDILYRNGTGQISIFGPSFPDENFLVNHSGPGYISMANGGPDTNGSQFFITTVITSWLDGKHVVFGKVLEGMEYVTAIEHNPTNDADRPILPSIIRQCGSLPM
ncbi:Peptidyl-prolyl cis-trans isomerase B2 [Pseudolycoriella hygida]|uniref:Peptidyl-prolyl cis-trans isomerase n=1 Tax=Pseudolycoriella hygida TaxID=35572 RepID=A0A9Q0RT08_9DIPT|nr:Peptidyl-prolyl cis-trans isomerase B2 [Pseudolycoriella hygida]KAJ6631726.1 Peptidyl-prolyl cis-trans isomerase B2 [Pseudolycoriella hygida]